MNVSDHIESDVSSISQFGPTEASRHLTKRAPGAPNPAPQAHCLRSPSIWTPRPDDGSSGV